MILSNGPSGSSLKALYFIFLLYVKSMAFKINCQSTTTSFVTLQRTQIFSLSFFVLFSAFPQMEDNKSTSHDPSSSSPSSQPPSEQQISKLIHVIQTISISIYFYTSWKEGHLHWGITHVFRSE